MPNLFTPPPSPGGPQNHFPPKKNFQGPPPKWPTPRPPMLTALVYEEHVVLFVWEGGLHASLVLSVLILNELSGLFFKVLNHFFWKNLYVVPELPLSFLKYSSLLIFSNRKTCKQGVHSFNYSFKLLWWNLWKDKCITFLLALSLPHTVRRLMYA